jgi:hypothetical protein
VASLNASEQSTRVCSTKPFGIPTERLSESLVSVMIFISRLQVPNAYQTRYYKRRTRLQRWQAYSINMIPGHLNPLVNSKCTKPFAPHEIKCRFSSLILSTYAYTEPPSVTHIICPATGNLASLPKALIFRLRIRTYSSTKDRIHSVAPACRFESPSFCPCPSRGGSPSFGKSCCFLIFVARCGRSSWTTGAKSKVKPPGAESL